MIHTLKKTNITLSNWICDSRMNWMKHRLYDYKEPIDVIRITKGYRPINGEPQLVWGVDFVGKNLEYIEFIYRKMYGHQEWPDAQIETVKKNIDHILNKADKLIIFA